MRGTRIALVCLLACGACGGDPVPPADAAADQGSPDAGLEWPELQIGSTFDPSDRHRIGSDAMAADYSCLDVRLPPTPGPAEPFTLTVDEATDRMPLAGACVHVYLEDEIVGSDTCAPTDPRTDALGQVTLDLPTRSPFTARVFDAVGATPRATTLDSTTYHISPEAPRWEVLFASGQTFNLFPTLLSRRAAPGAALIGARVLDCQERPVYGARLRLVLPDGTYLMLGTEQMDAFVTYFDDRSLPSRTQPWTHISGFAGFGNVPVVASGEHVRIEVWGRPPGADAPRVIGCNDFQVVADGFSAITLPPLIVGSPACPGL